MGVTDVAARVSAIATRQWGLLTTAQAKARGITPQQLARLADSGIVERIDQGIYAIPAAMDEYTSLRAAWISLSPATLAEERLADPSKSGVVSHTSAATLYNVGDLPNDEPEITVPGRKQSRRSIQLHRNKLSVDEVTIVAGLPVTRPARTVADLLRDGHDPSHVAEIAGEILQRGLASRKDIATAMEPLARRHGQPDGTALLEHLLDFVGLSSKALTASLVASDIGKTLIAAGQLSGIRSTVEMITNFDAASDTSDKHDFSAVEELLQKTALSEVLDGTLPRMDGTAIFKELETHTDFSHGELHEILSNSVATWLPKVLDSLPSASRPLEWLAFPITDDREVPTSKTN